MQFYHATILCRTIHCPKVKAEPTTEYKLYVSGINEDTKASDLQDLFSKHSKILDAKIIRFAKIPKQCFGLVTFESMSLVQKCIQTMDKNTRLKDNVITLSQVSGSLLVVFVAP